jgi:hypothetical protein
MVWTEGVREGSPTDTSEWTCVCLCDKYVWTSVLVCANDEKKNSEERPS